MFAKKTVTEDARKPKPAKDTGEARKFVDEVADHATEFAKAHKDSAVIFIGACTTNVNDDSATPMLSFAHGDREVGNSLSDEA